MMANSTVPLLTVVELAAVDDCRICTGNVLTAWRIIVPLVATFAPCSFPDLSARGQVLGVHHAWLAVGCEFGE